MTFLDDSTDTVYRRAHLKGWGRSSRSRAGSGCAWILPGAKEASWIDVAVRGSEGQMAPRLEPLGETLTAFDLGVEKALGWRVGRGVADLFSPS